MKIKKSINYTTTLATDGELAISEADLDQIEQALASEATVKLTPSRDANGDTVMSLTVYRTEIDETLAWLASRPTCDFDGNNDTCDTDTPEHGQVEWDAFAYEPATERSAEDQASSSSSPSPSSSSLPGSKLLAPATNSGAGEVEVTPQSSPNSNSQLAADLLAVLLTGWTEALHGQG